MSLHQSNRSKYKHFKYFAYSVVETLQASYIFYFNTKNRTYSMQCTLYKNSNSICRVKAYFTKKNPRE